MPINDLTLIIGGDAGQGVDSSGAGFCKALTRAGLHVFSVQDNRSRVRGGHNFYRITTADQPLKSWKEPVHLLVALTPESVSKHLDKMVPGSAVVFEEKFEVDRNEIEKLNILPVPVPLEKISTEHGGSKVMSNSAALGALAAITDFPLQFIHSVIQDNFKKKGDKIVQANLNVATAAHDFVKENFASKFQWKLKETQAPDRMVINGNQAISLGAVAAGCNFVSAYPMTPGSSVFEWLTAHGDRFGIVSKQAEDEIAAICMAIGASFVGARSLVPTAGGGFSLMVEAFGLAGMIETPLVVVVAQRPGPSTGLATRTEQSDLMFTIFASQGEFPRIILAPGTIQQCFQETARAFNLAEKYQTPVIILTDAFLASSNRTIDAGAIDFNSVEIDRGKLLSEKELDQLEEEYKRYKFTDDGISPRAIPGNPKAIFKTTSDEHDEHGAIVEDIDNRIKMQQKRMRKEEVAVTEMNDPILYGPIDADITLLCWGSTIAPLSAAVDLWNDSLGKNANILQFIDLWPFPVEKASEQLKKAHRLITVEGNYTGQLAKLIRMTTGIDVHEKILKYDGRPFSPEYILEKLKELA